MRGKYKAAFILPVNAKKILAESGWEFDSKEYISDDIEFFLTQELNLCFTESWQNTKCFSNENIEASIEYKEDKKHIRFIYFQIYHDEMASLKNAFFSSNLKDTQLFIPSEAV